MVVTSKENSAIDGKEQLSIDDMAIIAILTDPGKGGTFLTWSLHFLAGQDRYYQAIIDRYIDLPGDPLTLKNAHAFKPNQPTDFVRFQSYIEKLKKNSDHGSFHTIYFHHFQEWPFSLKHETTKQAIDQLYDCVDNILVLTNQKKHLLYEKSIRTRSHRPSFFDWSKIRTNDQEQFDDFIEYFFASSLEKWQKTNMADIWDRREFLALNYRHASLDIGSLIDLKKNHITLDCMEWFNLGDETIRAIFENLNINVDPSRFDAWQLIYQRWRKIHYQRLRFLWNFDKIVEYILHGYALDLERFDLDLLQEAIVQHEMIYRYGLNFKTYQLEKFRNTRQLHDLLEPNTHDVVPINAQ